MRLLVAAVIGLHLACAAAVQAAGVEVRVVDAAGRPVPDAVVFLESPAARAATRAAPLVEISQANRQFDPAVTVVPVGTRVSFPNRDTVRHHVYSFSPAKRFEIKLYVGTPAEPVLFDQPGIAVLGCNIHDQMAAWVIVVQTPWHGKTDHTGTVRWPDVPAGAYRLRAWHASLPPGDPASDQPLAVADRAAVTAAVTLTGAQP
jgi:plastocyanin